jgi:hypothetical protein
MVVKTRILENMLESQRTWLVSLDISSEMRRESTHFDYRSSCQKQYEFGLWWLRYHIMG